MKDIKIYLQERIELLELKLDDQTLSQMSYYRTLGQLHELKVLLSKIESEEN